MKKDLILQNMAVTTAGIISGVRLLTNGYIVQGVSMLVLTLIITIALAIFIYKETKQ